MFKEAIAQLIAKETKESPEHILEVLETPPSPELGDVAFPCFILAKAMKKAPAAIAEQLAAQLKSETIEKTVAQGPYVNFFIKPAAFAQSILEQDHNIKKTNKTIMVEYSQPNTHKEFHVGHLRTLFLGESIACLLEAVGNKVIRANYIGDVGAHVAKCLWCLQTYHASEKVPENKGKYLGKIYAEAVQRIAENEDLKEEVSKVQQALENKDKDMQLLWLRTKEWSMKEFEAIYKETNVHFDVIFFESEEEEPGKAIVQELIQKGIATKDQGAFLIDMEKEKLGIFLLLKSDGTSLYSTKDLSLAQKKFEKYKIDESIYVVDSRQKLYFNQLFNALQRLGFNKPLRHIPYEFVSLQEGVISSRSGIVALYEDYRDNMLKRTTEETKTRHPDWTENQIQETAQAITLSALKFGMLKIDTNREIIFNMEEALDLQGETGPYVLYAYARLQSLLKKFGKKLPKNIDYGKLATNEEKGILQHILQFQDVKKTAAEQNKPAMMARYVLDLAQLSNEWYHKENILKADEDTKVARLVLAETIGKTIKSALSLLGIKTVDAM